MPILFGFPLLMAVGLAGAGGLHSAAVRRDQSAVAVVAHLICEYLCCQRPLYCNWVGRRAAALGGGQVPGCHGVAGNQRGTSARWVPVVLAEAVQQVPLPPSARLPQTRRTGSLALPRRQGWHRPVPARPGHSLTGIRRIAARCRSAAWPGVRGCNVAGQQARYVLGRGQLAGG